MMSHILFSLKKTKKKQLKYLIVYATTKEYFPHSLVLHCQIVLILHEQKKNCIKIIFEILKGHKQIKLKWITFKCLFTALAVGVFFVCHRVAVT